MTAVRSVRSTAYGAKLFAYVLAVVAVGGALLGLGYSLAWPTLADVALGGAPAEEPATLAAGAVLGLLGVYVLGAGLLGAVHKLVADGVAAGVESVEVAAGGTATPAGEGGTADSEDQPATAPESGDQPDAGPGARPDSDPSREAGPGTGSEKGPAGTASPAGGTDGTVATADSQATLDAVDAEPGDAGPDSGGGTGGDHQPAEPDTRGPSEGSDPEPATEAAGGADAPGESGTGGADPDAPAEPDAPTEPDATANPDPEGGAVAGPEAAEDADDGWASTADLETEPVDVEVSDTAPADDESDPAPVEGGDGPTAVEGGSDPDPADVGVEDVGPPDRPGDRSPNPPEPSPEEIAFGSSGAETDREATQDAGGDSRTSEGGVTEREEWFGEDADGASGAGTPETGGGLDAEPAETGGASDAEPAESDSTDGFEPAGSTASADPLADPNEEA
jgi:hypothetical protein